LLRCREVTRQRANSFVQSDTRLPLEARDYRSTVLRFLRQGLPDIRAKRKAILSPRMVGVVVEITSDKRKLDERIEDCAMR
jgi:hypothetical protein